MTTKILHIKRKQLRFSTSLLHLVTLFKHLLNSRGVPRTIVIRNGKIVWKHGPYCGYFRLKYLGCPYRAYIKTAKNSNFCEELLTENDFETVLVTFYCYSHGLKASEAVQNVTGDQKVYRECTSSVIIYWITMI